MEASVAEGISWGALGPLLLLSTALMASPGPTTVSLVGVAAAFGLRSAVPYMIGEIVGTFLVLVAVAMGVTAMLLAVPALASVLVVIASGYILWLAFRIASAPPLSQAAETKAPSLGGGLLLGIANPKAWVAIAALFASVRFTEAVTVDAAIKVIVLTVMIVVVHVGWLVAGAAVAAVLHNPRASRVVNVSMAVLLVAATGLALVR